MAGNSRSGARWFYVQEGRRKGPVGLARLVELILVGGLPEDTLIWRSGLDQWIKASSLDEIKRQLPPPIPAREGAPGDRIDALPEAEALAEEEDAETGESEAADEPLLEGEAADASIDERHRRRHRIRHRLARARPRWLVPLIVTVLVAIVVLWYLLRRVNQVPPGRIILEGEVVVTAPPPA